MKISVGCELSYQIEAPCGFVFQIEAAKADGQIVHDESLILPDGAVTAAPILSR